MQTDNCLCCSFVSPIMKQFYYNIDVEIQCPFLSFILSSLDVFWSLQRVNLTRASANSWDVLSSHLRVWKVGLWMCLYHKKNSVFDLSEHSGGVPASAVLRSVNAKKIKCSDFTTVLHIYCYKYHCRLSHVSQYPYFNTEAFMSKLASSWS